MLSDVALLGAVEVGLVYALVAMGVFLSFRVLDFPDMTVDGGFPLGGAVSAVLISGGVHPLLSLVAAALAGALAGLITAVLNLRFRILHLLAGILTMTALYSISLRVMGKPNVALLGLDTVITPFEGLGLSEMIVRPIVVGGVALLVAWALARFLRTEFGLAMRATGANPRTARAQGVDTDFHIMVGIALSNALVALAGGLFAQTNGFADATMGAGTIVVGLAAVIVGETVLPSRLIGAALLGCVVGSVLYRLAVQLALSADVIGLRASDLNLVTAALVAAALILPRLRRAKPGAGR